MKHSPVPRKAPLFFCISLCLFISACGNGKKGASSQIETGIPKDLREAKLVFETEQGIHLQTPGKDPKLLVADGKWPRLSPDGTRVAFLKGRDVCILHLDSRETKVLAQTEVPKTLTFSGDGKEIWYSEGKSVRAVGLSGQGKRDLVKDGAFLEIDSGPNGKTLIATVKSFGYRLKVFDLETGKSHGLGKGCSASLSPDGKFATNNLDGHRELAILKVADGSREKTLAAPEDHLTDNQFWSNHPDWIMSVSETDHQLWVHRVRDGKVWKLGQMPGADRPDLWVPQGL